MSPLDVGNPHHIADMIAAADVAGCGHLVELLRPVMHGEMSLIVPQRDTRMPPLHRMERQARPVVVLVGDDDYRTPGPDGWLCAAKLRSWAAFAVVHGSGAMAEHYAMAARMAVKVGRLLFIETTSVAAQDWAGFLRAREPALPFMGVLPPDGAHPVKPAKAGMH